MLLDYKAVGEALSVSPRTVRKMVADGELEAIRVRGSVRFEPAAIARYVDEHRMETRMSDVSSSLVGNNDFGGYSKDLGVSAVSPGIGTATESGPAGGGQAWQRWQTGDDLVGDEPTVNRQPGHVSGGILPYAPEAADPFPGARPPGTQGAISSSAPGWFVDQQSNATDYDVGPDRDLSSPSRPWSSGPRPSDVGFTQAFYPEQSGQIPPAGDSTGTTGPRRLRRDDGASGVLP